MDLASIFGVHLSIASVILRIGIGGLLIVHGYPKLGAGRKGTGQWLASIGLPAGFATLAGIAEFFGGLALLLGILTPIIAGLVALWMLSTTWLSVAKIKKKLAGGYEIDIILLLAALALAALGGGMFSVDHLLGL